MVVPGRLGGWRGGRDGGAVIGQKAQEVEPSQRLRSVSCHPIAEAVRTDRIPRRVSRGRVRSQEGVGRALRKAPWMGWPGEGGSRDHGQCRMPPQRLPWHLPWRWAFPSPGCQPSPLPLESSSRTSNGVTKPSILLTDIQFTRPVMRIHFGGRQSCRWNSFSPEAHGVSCYTLALVDLSSIRKDWRVINAVELVIPPRAVRRVLKQVR